MNINSSNMHINQGKILWRQKFVIAAIAICSLLTSEATAQLVELAGPYRLESDAKSNSQAPNELTSEPLSNTDTGSDTVAGKKVSMNLVSGSIQPITTTQELSFAVESPVAETILPLGAREIGCQAALRWKPAIGLKQRAQTIQRLYCDQNQYKRQAANGIAQFLCLQAYHQEDLAAATAMRAYYSRIGIGEQKKLIAIAKQAVLDQQTKQNKLIDKGLAAGVDLSSLDRQDLDLDDLLLQAESQDDQLRRLLSGLTCIDYQVENRILEPLIVQHQELDCDALVAMALRDRYDLQSWRCLHGQINEESAAMFASIIATSAGSFGIPVPKLTGLKQLLCSSYDKALLAENLRQEVATIIATNESYAQQLVTEKCSQLQLAYQRHQLQLQRITSWEHRLKQIERLESHGEARPAERATAESGLLKARTDEATRRMEAKLAEVSLAEVIGGLAGKCCRGEAWFPHP